jgi:hypothetical protein
MVTSTFRIETTTCFLQPLEICMGEWQRQVDGWFNWIDDDPSIGFGNMTRKVFDDVVARHSDDLKATFGEPKFEDLIDNPALALVTLAYRELELQQVLTVQQGSGLYFSREELVDFGYRGTEEAMKSVAAGNETMSDHGLEHLGKFRNNWKDADELICHSGYWTCWWA